MGWIYIYIYIYIYIGLIHVKCMYVLDCLIYILILEFTPGSLLVNQYSNILLDFGIGLPGK